MIAGITLGVLVLILGLGLLWYYPKAQKAVAAGKAAAEVGRQLPDDLSQQNFVKAKADVAQLRQHLLEADTAMKQMGSLRLIPYVGRQYQAVQTLLVVGQDSGQAIGTLVDFLANVFEPFSSKGKISLATITPAEKGQLLKGMSDRGDDLRAAQVALHDAAKQLETIPSTGLIKPLAEVVEPLRQQFPLLTEALDQAIPATKVIPTILGYPTGKTYLFLLENNTELRPGGGFIGTYGIMKVSSGEITSLETDNVYNIDKAADSLATIQPPAAMQRMLKVNKWYFRDSNWSPDFPTSAAQALFLYQRQGGVKKIDGVIAVTPTAIAHLIGLVGKIKVSGLEFTAENFVDQLQYQVEQGFLKAGIPESQRKDIIGDLTSELMSRLLNLPVASWKDLFLSMNGELESKQILLFLKDTAAQNILVQQNWAGAIATTDTQDYAMVVDANLASLKTDQVMQREYSYAVEPEGDSAVATLTIKWRNTGKFDWKTTRYNTFTRVYVPSGSTLISSSGSQIRERSQAPGEVETSTELGKTVFSAFKSIEPGTESQLILKYRLPKKVAEQWKNGSYTLVWQKQPGMLAPKLNLTIKGTSKLGIMEGVDNQGRISKDTARFEGTLPRDRTIVTHIAN